MILNRDTSASEIRTLYDKISDVHIDGISEIAYRDGAETLAEIEVMISKHNTVPLKAIKFYEKLMRRKR